MSIRVMTAVWELSLPDSEKIVMLALADCANDEGLCWPSIATLTRKCSKGERTIQGVIKSLVAKGYIERDEIVGKGCKYRLHPQPLRPAAAAPREECPPQGVTPTPAAAADKPSRTITSSEAKASSDKRVREPKFDFPCPDGVDSIDWSALIANRKAKRAALSEGAHRQITRKLGDWARSGWPPGPIVAHAAERGWTTVFETDEMKNGHLGRNDRNTPSLPDGRKPGSIEQAGREAMAILNAQRNRGPGGQARPALDGGSHGRAVALPAPDGASGDDTGGPPRMAAGRGA